MTPIVHLKKADALPIMQKAFREGRLQAQQVQQPPIKGQARSCYYRHPNSGCPCIVGAVLDDGTAQRFDAYGESSVWALWTDNRLKVDDFLFFSIAQQLHDEWQKGDEESGQELVEHLGLPEETPLYPNTEAAA